MPTVLRVLLLSALFTLVPVAIGVVVADDRTPDTEPVAYAGTDLADFDDAVAVRRAPFCELIPDEAVDAALDGADAELTAYANGEQSEALPGGDVSHEYGCRYAAGGGSTARAWVFAPPVTEKRAAQLVKASRVKGCRARPDAPSYGEPSVALVCTAGDRRVVSHHGLFGDAWLACSITAPVGVREGDQVERAGRWCVAAAQAASTPAAD